MLVNLALASLGAGVLFGVMDAALHANPLAQRLHADYAPIAKAEVNAVAGVAIDLVYGLVLVLVFRQIAPVLPGTGGVMAGLVFGLGVWFFRVVMSVATTWMSLRIRPALLVYQLSTGLAEMLVLGAFLGSVVEVA